MAYDYVGARDEAFDLISEYGGNGSVVEKGSTGGFDSEGEPKAAVDDNIVNGIITPLIGYEKNEINGSDIQSGDAYVFFHANDSGVYDAWTYYFAPLAIKPSINMQTTINYETYRIVGMEKLTSVSGINVYVKLQLRK